MSGPDTRPAPQRGLSPLTERRVVMVASAGAEPSLADVVTNLATVCAQTDQQVVLVSTAGLASPGADAELPQATPLSSKDLPSPGNGAGLSIEDQRGSLLSGPLNPTDVENLLRETGVPGVSRLDLRCFVGHPAQVVIRVPDVLAALREVVDVVFLEVPSYLHVHYGEGLTPLADAVLVVAEREMTTLDEMRSISAVLRRLNAPVVGMALTDGGLEIYDWDRVDSEFQAPPDRPGDERDPTEQIHARPGDERDPTEQIPISAPNGVASAPPFDELPVVEHAPRQV